MFQIFCFLLLTIVTQYGNTTNEIDERVQDVKVSTGVRSDREEREFKNYNFPEFDKIATFLQPLVKQVENEKCSKQLRNYVKSLKNSSLWAVQMFDASAKVPQGLLTSDAYDLGNYDGCVEINLRRAKEDNIFGKYCLASVALKDLDSGDVFIEPEISTWEKLMVLNSVPVFKYGFINGILRTAVCVPNECTPRDVEKILRYLYDNATRIIGKKADVWVSETACSIKNEKENKTVNFMTRAILLLILWVTLSTILDLLGWLRKTKGTWINIFMTFSAFKNFRILTSTNSPEHIPVVSSIKVYSFIIFVIIRRLSLSIMGPIVNRRTVDEVFGRPLREGIFDTGNNLIADTFLAVEGFSNFYKVCSHYRNNSRISSWRVYLLEYLKTIPQYILVILFYGHILETVGSGPMWKERTGDCVENCRRNWATNLLHLNNLMNKNKMCIFESWYFAVIAQCFVLISIVARVMIKSSTTGLTLLGLLTATTFVLPMAMTLEPHRTESSEIQWHERINVETINRALPYFVGACSSAVYTRIQDRRWKFSKIWSKWFSLIIVTLSIVAASVCLLVNSKKPAAFEWAFINALRQLIWSLAIAGVVIGVSTKKLPSLTPIFKQKCIFLLGRLSYPYILVLGLVQLYTTGIIRTLDYLSFSRLIWMSTADLLATWIIAIIFYMIIHRPISNILHEKILGVPEKTPSNNSQSGKQTQIQNKYKIN